MNRDEFLEHLRTSGLLSPEQWQLATGRFAADAAPTALAEELVAEGILTPFQARRILAGESKHLRLGPYLLLDELGRGGMGQVFKACHTRMNRTVALKVLAPTLRTDEQAVRWFEREVRLLPQLQHPNIVLAYDANEADGLHFLVMEYVDGQSLAQLVRSGGPLPVHLACAMMQQAALALHYGHQNGMVHRDIKPANLLVPRAEEAPTSIGGGELGPRPPLVKLVDFGLARLHGAVGTETLMLDRSQNFAGTPDYVSPEQCQDVHAVDIRSDLYSLGCTFYFALTGRAPFEDAEGVAKLIRHLTETPPPVEDFRPDVPAGVSAILRRLLEKKPEQRYRTPLELAQALRPWCDPTASSPSTPAAQGNGLDDQFAEAGATSVSPPIGAAPATLAASAKRCLEPISADSVVDQLTPVSVPRVTVEAPAASAAPRAPADIRATYRDLRAAWRRWTDVVAGCAERGGRCGWDPVRYRGLYERLRILCDQAAEDIPDGRTLFLQLRETVQPWISPECLERTDPEILRSLLRRCREAEALLGVRRPLEHLGGLLRAWGVPALIVALLVLWARSIWVVWLSTGAGARQLTVAALLNAARGGSLPELLAVALPALIVVVLGLLLCRR
jgi:serine/threonine protein kinase